MTGKLIGQHQLLKWPLLSQLLHELAFPPHPASKSTSMVVIDLALVVTRGHAPQVWVGLLLGSLPPVSIFTHRLRTCMAQTSNYHLSEPMSQFVLYVLFSPGRVSSLEFSILAAVPFSILSSGWTRTKRTGRKRETDPLRWVAYSPSTSLFHFFWDLCLPWPQLLHGSTNQWRSMKIHQGERPWVHPSVCIFVCLWRCVKEKYHEGTTEIFSSPNDCF